MSQQSGFGLGSLNSGIKATSTPEFRGSHRSPFSPQDYEQASQLPNPEVASTNNSSTVGKTDKRNDKNNEKKRLAPDANASQPYGLTAIPIPSQKGPNKEALTTEQFYSTIDKYCERLQSAIDTLSPGTLSLPKELESSLLASRAQMERIMGLIQDQSISLSELLREKLNNIASLERDFVLKKACAAPATPGEISIDAWLKAAQAAAAHPHEKKAPAGIDSHTYALCRAMALEGIKIEEIEEFIISLVTHQDNVQYPKQFSALLNKANQRQNSWTTLNALCAVLEIERAVTRDVLLKEIEIKRIAQPQKPDEVEYNLQLSVASNALSERYKKLSECEKALKKTGMQVRVREAGQDIQRTLRLEQRIPLMYQRASSLKEQGKNKEAAELEKQAEGLRSRIDAQRANAVKDLQNVANKTEARLGKLKGPQNNLRKLAVEAYHTAANAQVLRVQSLTASGQSNPDFIEKTLVARGSSSSQPMSANEMMYRAETLDPSLKKDQRHLSIQQERLTAVVEGYRSVQQPEKQESTSPNPAPSIAIEKKAIAYQQELKDVVTVRIEQYKQEKTLSVDDRETLSRLYLQRAGISQEQSIYAASSELAAQSARQSSEAIKNVETQIEGKKADNPEERAIGLKEQIKHQEEQVKQYEEALHEYKNQTGYYQNVKKDKDVAEREQKRIQQMEKLLEYARGQASYTKECLAQAEKNKDELNAQAQNHKLRSQNAAELFNALPKASSAEGKKISASAYAEEKMKDSEADAREASALADKNVTELSHKAQAQNSKRQRTATKIHTHKGIQKKLDQAQLHAYETRLSEAQILGQNSKTLLTIHGHDNAEVNGKIEQRFLLSKRLLGQAEENQSRLASQYQTHAARRLFDVSLFSASAFSEHAPLESKTHFYDRAQRVGLRYADDDVKKGADVKVRLANQGLDLLNQIDSTAYNNDDPRSLQAGVVLDGYYSDVKKREAELAQLATHLAVKNDVFFHQQHQKFKEELSALEQEIEKVPQLFKRAKEQLAQSVEQAVLMGQNITDQEGDFNDGKVNSLFAQGTLGALHAIGLADDYSGQAMRNLSQGAFNIALDFAHEREKEYQKDKDIDQAASAYRKARMEGRVFSTLRAYKLSATETGYFGPRIPLLNAYLHASQPSVRVSHLLASGSLGDSRALQAPRSVQENVVDFAQKQLNQTTEGAWYQQSSVWLAGIDAGTSLCLTYLAWPALVALAEYGGASATFLGSTALAVRVGKVAKDGMQIVSRSVHVMSALRRAQAIAQASSRIALASRNVAGIRHMGVAIRSVGSALRMIKTMQTSSSALVRLGGAMLHSLTIQAPLTVVTFTSKKLFGENSKITKTVHAAQQIIPIGSMIRAAQIRSFLGQLIYMTVRQAGMTVITPKIYEYLGIRNEYARESLSLLLNVVIDPLFGFGKEQSSKILSKKPMPREQFVKTVFEQQRNAGKSPQEAQKAAIEAGMMHDQTIQALALAAVEPELRSSNPTRCAAARRLYQSLISNPALLSGFMRIQPKSSNTSPTETRSGENPTSDPAAEPIDLANTGLQLIFDRANLKEMAASMQEAIESHVKKKAVEIEATRIEKEAIEKNNGQPLNPEQKERIREQAVQSVEKRIATKGLTLEECADLDNELGPKDKKIVYAQGEPESLQNEVDAQLKDSANHPDGVSVVISNHHDLQGKEQDKDIQGHNILIRGKVKDEKTGEDVYIVFDPAQSQEGPKQEQHAFKMTRDALKSRLLAVAVDEKSSSSLLKDGQKPSRKIWVAGGNFVVLDTYVTAQYFEGGIRDPLIAAFKHDPATLNLINKVFSGNSVSKPEMIELIHVFLAYAQKGKQTLLQMYAMQKMLHTMMLDLGMTRSDFAMAYFSKEPTPSRKDVLKMVKNNGYLLMFLPEEFFYDQEIMETALKRCPRLFRFICLSDLNSALLEPERMLSLFKIAVEAAVKDPQSIMIDNRTGQVISPGEKDARLKVMTYSIDKVLRFFVQHYPKEFQSMLLEYPRLFTEAANRVGKLFHKIDNGDFLKKLIKKTAENDLILALEIFNHYTPKQKELVDEPTILALLDKIALSDAEGRKDLLSYLVQRIPAGKKNTPTIQAKIKMLMDKWYPEQQGSPRKNDNAVKQLKDALVKAETEGTISRELFEQACREPDFTDSDGLLLGAYKRLHQTMRRQIDRETTLAFLSKVDPASLVDAIQEIPHRILRQMTADDFITLLKKTSSELSADEIVELYKKIPDHVKKGPPTEAAAEFHNRFIHEAVQMNSWEGPAFVEFFKSMPKEVQEYAGTMAVPVPFDVILEYTPDVLIDLMKQTLLDQKTCAPELVKRIRGKIKSFFELSIRRKTDKSPEVKEQYERLKSDLENMFIMAFKGVSQRGDATSALLALMPNEIKMSPDFWKRLFFFTPYDVSSMPAEMFNHPEIKSMFLTALKHSRPDTVVGFLKNKIFAEKFKQLIKERDFQVEVLTLHPELIERHPELFNVTFNEIIKEVQAKHKVSFPDSVDTRNIKSFVESLRKFSPPIINWTRLSLVDLAHITYNRQNIGKMDPKKPVLIALFTAKDDHNGAFDAPVFSALKPEDYQNYNILYYDVDNVEEATEIVKKLPRNVAGAFLGAHGNPEGLHWGDTSRSGKTGALKVRNEVTANFYKAMYQKMLPHGRVFHRACMTGRNTDTGVDSLGEYAASLIPDNSDIEVVNSGKSSIGGGTRVLISGAYPQDRSFNPIFIASHQLDILRVRTKKDGKVVNVIE